MSQIFDFDNYREYLDAWISGHGERSYGLKGRLAEALGVSSSLISQILKGDKTLTPDQTSDLADHMALSEFEAEFLHLLVERDRAGSPRYRAKLDRKIAAARAQARKVSKHLPPHKALNEEQRAIYYSSWLFTGARNLLAVPGCDRLDALAQKLGVEPAVMGRIVRFLLDHELALETGGALSFGPASVYIDSDSPFVNKHHQNWRFQGIRCMEKRNDQDLFFSAPMSLSREAADQIRAMLPEIIGRAMKIAGPSPSETVACLNIDWFGYA